MRRAGLEVDASHRRRDLLQLTDYAIWLLLEEIDNWLAGVGAEATDLAELNARYVVEGSVRKAGNRVRVTVQLINAETSHHVWADRYDRELEDIFEVQDEITKTISSIIEPNVEREELWHELELGARQRIHPVISDSLSTMDQLIDSGEHFDLALLDSLHTEQYVREEFGRATQLVRPGGLILVHDVLLKSGSVDQALQRIAADGYGVSRLWTAEGVKADDNGLGIAVIENRRRSPA